MATQSVVNVASVPHRSPFRYPGGKTWLVPVVRRWLKSLARKPEEFAEPFAGGGIVGLSALFEEFVERLTLVELDENVAAVWRVILNGKAQELADRILAFEMTTQNVKRTLSESHASLFETAFATILRNRVQRGGIIAPGASLMKHGENGRGIASRWYPETLSRRIREIGKHKRQISFVHGDGLQFIRENVNRTNIVFFIDPPYTVAGRRLYLHSEMDHSALFQLMTKAKGDFLMTYDNAGPIRTLAENFGFELKQVRMKNTHHEVMSELLIGRNLEWL